ncbi:glycoside hydrolase family 16 protein [Neolentinus lepideus HHB14362 ss-1]|uniref:Glycoside hydrolase family 16 protein n=1 Tax=Neolentinus lepideus HHB14362 ss-1 TaxID=1314782 RepID=A0A165QQF6_9AGAM|nr:glycoside hydrolase family 16 protein [Neolentinus lepideus HHB14362 ss-1]
MTRFTYLLSILSVLSAVASYDLVHDYSGQTFFDGWDFYGNWDNLTLGDVWWLDEQDAFSQGLAQINSAGRAVLRVDNATDVAYNQKRNSIRVTTQASYGIGSLWIIDLVHIPYGCSVWPAFWTKGPLWPNDGEIDIIEAVNVMPINQMALHTTPGCFHPGAGDVETGNPIQADLDCSQAPGCVVQETKPNSYNTGLAAAGGGVWATQFDVSGVFIWFWSRPDVPASIASATNTSSITDISQWGLPSASYPATSCNITEFFTAQQLVLDITLCGDWAGIPPVYDPTCASQGSTGLCYNDNVVGPGSPKYDEAYFEINYIRAYTTGGPVSPISTPTSMPGSGYNVPGTTTTTSVPTTSASYTPPSPADRNVGQVSWMLPLVGVGLGAVLVL